MDRLPPDRRAAELARDASRAQRAVEGSEVHDAHVGEAPRQSNDPYARQLRRCRACGSEAVRCYHVTLHRTNGLPSGTTYDHVCPQCRRTFRTESIWGSFLSGSSAVLLLGIFGPLMAFADFEDWWMIALAVAMILAGALLGVQTTRRIYERVANRVVGASR